MADWEDLTPRGSSGGWEDLQPKKSKERTWGEAAKDVAAGAVSGTGALVQLPGQLYGLATGNFEDTGALGAGKKIQEFGEEMKSPGLKAREEERTRKIAEAEKEGQLAAAGTAFKETIKDPALLANFLAEQAPQLAVPFGAAKVGRGVSMASSAGKQLAAKEAVEAAGQAGTKAAVGAGAVQQGADVGAQTYVDTYEELKKRGVPEPEAAKEAINLARASGASGAIISLLAQRLPGAKTIEESLAGVPGKAGRVIGGAKGALGEAASEVAEEVGGKFGQNLAMRDVNPEQDLTQGLGQTAGMAAIGGVGMGGITGLLQHPHELPKVPEVEPPPEVKKPVDIAPPAPPAPPPTNEVNIKPADLDALKNYTQGLPDDAASVFANVQNRDRTTPASIQQMQGISSNPDYDRLKTSPDFGAGAPVVISDVNIPENHLGRVDVVTAADGRKIPVQYAVVDAENLLPSHTADGRSNADYANLDVHGIRAIAGNGRVAGLQAAYGADTAGKYRSAFESDTQHGIDQGAILNMAQPVLVRIMPKSYITADIGDVSNVGGQLRLSPVESAKNDGNRIDLNGLKFNEDGGVNTNSLIQFVRSMPKEEQGELMDKNGMPNSKAIDRLNNAIFYKAYGSDSLIDLYAQAADPEAKLILQAMARAASKVAKLEGAGELDIRKHIIDAAELAVNARRNGIKLKDYVQQGDIGMDPYTRQILEMFAENGRSGKRMGEMLERLADEVARHTGTEEDMFGEKPKASLDDIFKVLKEKPTEPGLFDEKPEAPKEKQENIQFKIDKSPAEIADEIDGMTVPQLAQWMVDNAPNRVAKFIAEKVLIKVNDLHKLGVLSKAVQVARGKSRSKNSSAAVWRPVWSPNLKNFNMRVEFNGPYPAGQKDNRVGTTYRTIMHEMVHVATLGQVYQKEKTKHQKDLTALLRKIRAQYDKDVASGNYHPAVRGYMLKNNSLDNIAEMVAWGTTDSDFQDYLKGIKVGENQSAFSKLVQICREMLGLAPQYQTALDALMQTTESMLEQHIDEYAGNEIKAPKARRYEKKNAEQPTQMITAKEVEEEAKKFLQKRKPFNPESFEGVDDDFMSKANPIFRPQKKTIIDRIEGMRDGFWRKLAQGIADQYRTIKDYSEEAYMMARMSRTIDGALEGLMFHGQVFDDGGALNIKHGTKGLVEVLQPLGKEVDRYQMWIALNRESQLPANKRSKIDNLDELVARRDELIDGDIDGKPRKEVYEGVRKEMNKLNRSVLKVALDKGLIDSTANAIGRLEDRISDIENNDDLSDSKKESDIEELEAQIEELRRNPIGYERFIADINYIPFYREMEDGDISKVMTSTGLSNQHFSKALEGGESPFADLMENTLRNWSHILSASMKNGASKATLDAAVKLGGAEPNLKQQFAMIDGKVHILKRTKSGEESEVYGDGEVKPWMTTSTAGAVKVMIDGQPAYYKVLDPMLLESITSIGYMGPKSKFLDVARDFKNMLQFGVTLSPAFKIRNLFRDSISAMAISGLSKDPFANVARGWAETDKNNPAHISALAGGGIFNFGSIVEGDQARLVKRLVEMGVPEDHIIIDKNHIKNALKVTWDKYQEWGNKSEAANRMALYSQMRDKGMSHLEASFNARDLLDFSMQGAWPAFRLLTQVIPFLNARVQGLYKLGKDGVIPTSRVFYNTITGKEIEQTDKQKAESFTIVTSAVMMASLALYFAFKDDDDFKKRDEWDRDNFWWFKLPNMDYAFRIPKPFEVGAFGTMAERVAEQIFDQGAEGKQFEDSLKRMMGDTFALNPTPQAFKPLLDLYANKDSFTGAPIETAGMERLSKQERSADSTSPLAKALGGMSQILPASMELSPVQADYAIKAYFGWLGGTVSEASHYAVMPFKNGAYPDSKWVDRVSVGFIKSLPSNQSRYVTAFYENNKQISQAYADMRHYAEAGDSAKVQEILEEKKDMILMAKFYDKTSKEMSSVRRQIQVVMNDDSMSGADKRMEIDRLKELISMLAEQAERARKEIKKGE